MKNAVIIVIVVLSLMAGIKWYNGPNNGIHALGKNVCLIEGECVMINWDATEVEAEYALQKWASLKERRKS